MRLLNVSLAWQGPRFHAQHRKAKQFYQRSCVVAYLSSQHVRGTRIMGLKLSLATLDSVSRKNCQ